MATNLKNGETPSIRPLIDNRGVRQSLNCGRSKVWELENTDPDFPPARIIAGKKQWFVDEIETYKASRPLRRYAEPDE